MDKVKEKAAKAMAVALGKAIRKRRKVAGLNQEALASYCDLHRAYLGAIERGEQNITVFTLSQIAKGLEIKPSTLLRDIGL